MKWPFDKSKADKTEYKNKVETEEIANQVTDETASQKKEKFEKLKSGTLKEFDKKVDALMSEHKVWLEQYLRNMKSATENYDRRVNEFDTKVNIIRETLEKNIDARTDIIESLGNILDFDKVVKYQTSGIIDIPNDLGDLRGLGEGNWEIIILAKRIKEK